MKQSLNHRPNASVPCNHQQPGPTRVSHSIIVICSMTFVLLSCTKHSPSAQRFPTRCAHPTALLPLPNAHPCAIAPESCTSALPTPGQLAHGV
eukprot:3906891-Prymnesium_polylepis.1